VAGDHHALDMGRTVAHLDRLLDDLRRCRLPGVKKARRVGGVSALDIKILRVHQRAGHAPGDVHVVAVEDAGDAGKRGARGRVFRAFQMHLVEQVGELRRQVRVAAEQGAAVEAVRRRHDPTVAPDPGVSAAGCAKPGAHAVHLAEQQTGGVGHAQGCAAAHGFGDDRALAGIFRFKLRGCVRIQRGQQLEAAQFAFPVGAHGPGQRLEVGQGIERRPRFRRHAQQVQLGRQATAVGGHECVDAVHIPLQALARGVVEAGQFLFRQAAKADDTAEAVGVQRGAAEDLGQATVGDAAAVLHLPHAILGVGPAEQTQQVGLALRVEMGDAMLVAQHLGGRVQKLGGDVAIQPWCWPAHPPPVDEQKEGAAQHDQDERNQWDENEW
jgi:hypothetical protein